MSNSNTKRINISVSKSNVVMLERLDQASQRIGVNRSDLIWQAVEEYLDYLDVYHRGSVQPDAKVSEVPEFLL